MKILFAGTPEIALPTLLALHGHHQVLGVLTAPDAISGRGRNLEPSPVKVCAQDLGIRVFTPEKLDAGFREQINELKPDILVCFAYGKIFGPKFLALFPQGGVNIHPSLLPDLRGPSPLASAILLGRKTTGITVQTLSLAMDAGDILVQEARELGGEENTEELGSWAAERGAVLILAALAGLENGSITPRPQEGQASFCQLLSKEDGKVDWSRSAKEIDCQIRAFYPWPRAFTHWEGQLVFLLDSRYSPDLLQAGDPGPEESGRVVRIDKKLGILVQTGAGLCSIKRLQIQGKKPMDAASFINGARGFIGAKLGDS